MLTRIAADCDDGYTCPTVFANDQDASEVVVQGYADGAAGEVTTPAGERAVRIPAALLLEAAERLKEAQGARS